MKHFEFGGLVPNRPPFKMVKFVSSFFVLVNVIHFVSSRPSELFGSGVSQTGSKWPPYPWAGLDYWALQSGFYGPEATKDVATIEQVSEKRSDQVPENKVAHKGPKRVVQKVSTPKSRPMYYVMPQTVFYG